MVEQAKRLYFLLRAYRGKTVSYADLATAVGTHSHNRPQYLWLLIFTVRDNLPPRQEIINVRGYGYRLVEREPLVAPIPQQA